MNRRDFILGTAASAFAGCATGSGAPARAVCPGSPRFHVFSKMFQPPVTADPYALCDLFAAAGYDGVQWTVRPGGHCEPGDAAAKLPALVKAAAARGLACESICTAIVDGDDPAAERIAKAAADCGISQMRVGYYFYDERRETFAQSMDRFRRSFASLERLGRKSGVRASYQNHSTWGPAIFGGTVWDIHEMVRDLDPAFVGIEYDPMHACLETYESWRHGFELVSPWIASVDLKDFRYKMDAKKPGRMAKDMVPAGEGVVPWGEVARRIAANGVDPLYILHFEYDFDRTDLKKTVGTELSAFKAALAATV